MFSASVTQPLNNATLTVPDIAYLSGATGRIVVVRRAELWVTSTAAVGLGITAIKRSSLSTGGTSSAMFIGGWDTSLATSIANAFVWTASPTTMGVSLASIKVMPVVANTSTGTPAPTGFILDLTEYQNPALFLRAGATDNFALNISSGVIPSGSTVYITFWWEEF